METLENEQRASRREMTLLRSQLATVEVMSSSARQAGSIDRPVYPHAPPVVVAGSFDNARMLLDEVNRAREQAKLHVRRWQVRVSPGVLWPKPWRWRPNRYVLEPLPECALALPTGPFCRARPWPPSCLGVASKLIRMPVDWGWGEG